MTQSSYVSLVEQCDLFFLKNNLQNQRKGGNEQNIRHLKVCDWNALFGLAKVCIQIERELLVYLWLNTESHSGSDNVNDNIEYEHSVWMHISHIPRMKVLINCIYSLQRSSHELWLSSYYFFSKLFFFSYCSYIDNLTCRLCMTPNTSTLQTRHKSCSFFYDWKIFEC